MPPIEPHSFRERLLPPWWYWTIALLWALTLGTAYGYALGAVVGVAVGLAALALASLGLVQVAAVVTVSDQGLSAGRSVLPWESIGAVDSLDALAARHTRGVGADSRAFVLLRGWVATAVTVEVVDPQDPTPYWYVSTRHPEQLAAALAVNSIDPLVHPSPNNDMARSTTPPTAEREK